MTNAVSEIIQTLEVDYRTSRMNFTRRVAQNEVFIHQFIPHSPQ